MLPNMLRMFNTNMKCFADSVLWLTFQTEVQPERAGPNMSFVDYQTSMVQLSKRIAQIAHEMVGKASSPETAAELGHMANVLTRHYSDLADQQQGASAVCPNAEVSQTFISLNYVNI